ncbi:CFI-box-CTERM domain-containing protein [Nitrosopumilus sp.]|uniref:CFI-box-CTERM domain-containing protein n=1 Tax=Nitrosopumilus sp. TaxID=2024843 RepID=UPI00260891E6|nr:CFI-box-CTERM domain-containing protein [Nitrosopumilus sp.]
MMIPAFAEVTSISMGKSFYTNAEKISFVGTENEGSVLVNVIVKDPNGKSKLLGGFSDPDGEFETIPQSVDNIFSLEGIYNATAFVEKIENGTTIQLQYDGDQVFEFSSVVLQLKSIDDKTIEEGKTLTFTVTLSESVEGVVFSLEKNPPTGATINAETGKFVWTPTTSQGPASYLFDIVATKGAQSDRESIKVTVTEKTIPQPQPEPEPKDEPEPEPKSEELKIPAPFVDETKDPQSYVDRYNNEKVYKDWFDKTYPEYESIYQAVGLEEPLEIPAPFVDKTKDPQSYVDRYNNEKVYKDWFDKTYPEYESIYQAVGLEEPKVLAPFVDPNLDPQYYIDRYNNEITYKNWFDKTYPDMTIYEAVGLDEPTTEEPKVEEEEFGECGEGTELVNGICMIVDNSKGGGCLIATATYGSEMAPQVQFLREIRDNQLMSTESGSSFMSGFNQLYYSFSPYIADLERENPAFKEMVKIGITPMLSSLSIMSLADSEFEIVSLGIGVILLNIGMYVGLPAILIIKTRKFIRI